jgi:cytochrome bd-type quinol oxidase subunit 1
VFLLRVLVVGGFIFLAVSLVLYAFTKDRRYLQFAKFTGKFVAIIAASILLFFLFERLVLVL